MLASVLSTVRLSIGKTWLRKALFRPSTDGPRRMSPCMHCHQSIAALKRPHCNFIQHLTQEASSGRRRRSQSRQWVQEAERVGGDRKQKKRKG